MFTDLLEVNGFSIIVSINEIIPPLASGTKYEAKVTKIYDHNTDQDINLTPENTCMAHGTTEEEAYNKSQDSAREWAQQQR